MERRGLWMAAGAAAGAVLAWAGFVEPRRLRVRREEVAIPGLAEDDRIVVAHLSDLHLRRVGPFQRRIAGEVEAAAPDVVVLTGDTIHSPGALVELDVFLRLLPASLPKVAVMGNWERKRGIRPGALDRVLARHHGVLLVNRAIHLTVRGRSLLVTGVDDAARGNADPVRALEAAHPVDAHLFITHCPVVRDRLEDAAHEAAWRRGEPDLARSLLPDLVLAGHTHGGQVRLPGYTWTPSHSGRYVSGRYRVGGPDLYVSRGLGSFVPVRLGAPPELVLFRLHAGPPREALGRGLANPTSPEAPEVSSA